METAVSVLIREADMNFGMELIGSAPQPAVPQRPQQGSSVDLGSVNLRVRNAETWDPTDLEFGVPQIRQGVSRVAEGRADRQGLSGKCAGSIESLLLLPASESSRRLVSACTSVWSRE